MRNVILIGGGRSEARTANEATAAVAFRHNDVAGAHRRRRVDAATGGVFTLRRRRTPLPATPPLSAYRIRRTPRVKRLATLLASERAGPPPQPSCGRNNKYVRGGHQTARPIRFRCGISPFPLPDEDRSTTHVRSLARTARPTTDGRAVADVCTRSYAEQRRRATATARIENPVRVTRTALILLLHGWAKAVRLGGGTLLLLLLLLFLLQNHPCNMCFSHHHRRRIITNAHFSPAKRRTAKTQILAQIIL